jgi:hypothetical protein
VLSITDIVLLPSSHIQLPIEDKIGYVFRLEQAIIRPITIALKRKSKTGSRCEISDHCIITLRRPELSHLFAVLNFLFDVLVIGLRMACSNRNR